MKVLVTGASGFVASHLIPKLLDQNHAVYGLIRDRSDSRRPYRLKQNIPLLHADMTNYNDVESVVKQDFDWIFHLAAQSYIPTSFSNPLQTIRVNGDGTANLLEAVRKYSHAKIIFAGTSEEYGIQYSDPYQWDENPVFPEPTHYPELPINENNFLRPQSAYGVAKVFADFLCRQYHQTYGIDTVVSRAFNHEGRARGPHFVTATIARQVVECKLGLRDWVSLGDWNVTRDFSHVDDIVDGYILLAERGRSGEIYVQGSGLQTSIFQYLEMCIEYLENSKTKPTFAIGNDCGNEVPADRKSTEGRFTGYTGIEVENGSVYHLMRDQARMRKSDVPRLQANPAKMYKLGWKPKKTVKDIVADQVEYYREEENRNVV